MDQCDFLFHSQTKVWTHLFPPYFDHFPSCRYILETYIYNPYISIYCSVSLFHSVGGNNKGSWRQQLAEGFGVLEDLWEVWFPFVRSHRDGCTETFMSQRRMCLPTMNSIRSFIRYGCIQKQTENRASQDLKFQQKGEKAERWQKALGKRWKVKLLEPPDAVTPVQVPVVVVVFNPNTHRVFPCRPLPPCFLIISVLLVLFPTGRSSDLLPGGKQRLCHLHLPATHTFHKDRGSAEKHCHQLPLGARRQNESNFSFEFLDYVLPWPSVKKKS